MAKAQAAKAQAAKAQAEAVARLAAEAEAAEEARLTSAAALAQEDTLAAEEEVAEVPVADTALADALARAAAAEARAADAEARAEAADARATAAEIELDRSEDEGAASERMAGLLREDVAKLKLELVEAGKEMARMREGAHVKGGRELVAGDAPKVIEDPRDVKVLDRRLKAEQEGAKALRAAEADRAARPAPGLDVAMLDDRRPQK